LPHRRDRLGCVVHGDVAHVAGPGLLRRSLHDGATRTVPDDGVGETVVDEGEVPVGDLTHSYDRARWIGLARDLEAAGNRTGRADLRRYDRRAVHAR